MRKRRNCTGYFLVDTAVDDFGTGYDVLHNGLPVIKRQEIMGDEDVEAEYVDKVSALLPFQTVHIIYIYISMQLGVPMKFLMRKSYYHHFESDNQLRVISTHQSEVPFASCFVGDVIITCFDRIIF